jgi:hypothetical protein
MQQLAEVIKKEAGDGEAVLVLGDFNFDARQKAELHSHQAELCHGTGRSCRPVDIVAATYDGDHPATYGWRTNGDKLAEPFLTSTEALDAEQSIDHVYYWPRETRDVPENRIVTNVAVSEPRCRLQTCPYEGPTNEKGEMPAHVSDHCGWSVEIDLKWNHLPSLSPDVIRENARFPLVAGGHIQNMSPHPMRSYENTESALVGDCCMPNMTPQSVEVFADLCKNLVPFSRRVLYWLGSFFWLPVAASYFSAATP